MPEPIFDLEDVDPALQPATRRRTSSTGVVTTQMDDFVITTATVKNGVLVATTMEDMVRVPSALTYPLAGAPIDRKQMLPELRGWTGRFR